MKHICTAVYSPVFEDAHKSVNNSEFTSHNMKDKSNIYVKYALFAEGSYD